MSIPGKTIKDITSEDAVYGTRSTTHAGGGIVLALAGCAFPFPLAAGVLKSL